MSESSWRIIGIALGVISVFGITGISAAYRFSRSWGRQYRFLRLHRTETLDIVLPTSERKRGGLGISYVRSMTSVGNMRGATQIAQAVGRISRTRRISVAVSEEIESRLQCDLVILGLPGKNAASRMVLGHLQARHPEIELDIAEAAPPGCSISLAGHTENYSFEKQPRGSAYPTRDVALIVVWANPLSLRRRRLLLCAGFTTYGTAAAASYLVHELPDIEYKLLRKRYRELPSLLSPRVWPCFAMLIEVMLINDQVVHRRRLAFTPLPDPRYD